MVRRPRLQREREKEEPKTSKGEGGRRKRGGSVMGEDGAEAKFAKGEGGRRKSRKHHGRGREKEEGETSNCYFGNPNGCFQESMRVSTV